MSKKRKSWLNNEKGKARAEEAALLYNNSDYNYSPQVEEANKVIALLTSISSASPNTANTDNLVAFVPRETAGENELSDLHGKKLTAESTPTTVETSATLVEPTAQEIVEPLEEVPAHMPNSPTATISESLLNDVQSTGFIYLLFLLSLLFFFQEALLMGVYTLLILVSGIAVSGWIVSKFWGLQTLKLLKP